MAFVPGDAFELTAGGDALTDYQFGKKSVHHQFCARCGVRSFSWGANAEGKVTYCVNTRCLDNVDEVAIGQVPTKMYDGKSL
jgi:hypothetical protein